MHTVLYLITLILVLNSQTDVKLFKHDMLQEVNEIRAKGCQCGNKIMAPAGALQWSDQLEASARRHASDMKRHKYFSHYSRKGKSVGDRLDELGYNWQHIGENIATGQTTWEQVIEDWLNSPTHCEMIMNQNMVEMGISRVGDYWVQHFGAQMRG